MRNAHLIITGAIVLALASMPIVTSVPAAANASQRVAVPVRAAPAAPFAFHFAARSYAIGGRTLNIFTGPPDCTGGLGIASGVGGFLWATLSGTGCNNGDIVKFTTAGSAVAYPLPAGIAAPGNIVENGAATQMWFNAQSGTDRLGTINASGGIGDFPVPGNPSTSGIVLGPDGRYWFGVSSGLIAAATSSGSITEYKLPSSADVVGQVTVGSDGSIWFTNVGSDGSSYGLGKISPSGVSTGYLTHLPANGVTAGADGNMWFTVAEQSKVGYIATSGGTPTVFSAGISGIPNQITTGPDDNEYFDEIVPSTGQAAVAQVTLTGTVTEYALPYGFSPSGITVGPDGNIWVIDSGHDQIGQLSVHPATLDDYRFETGPNLGAATTILDTSYSPRNGSRLSGSPEYSSTVPVSLIPKTGQPDNFSLWQRHDLPDPGGTIILTPPAD